MIVLEIPEEVNAVAPALLTMLETLQKQVERGRIGASVDFDDFEQQLADKVSAVERAALGIALGALDVDFPKVLIDGVLHARVLRADGAPLPNLFAGGGAACGISGSADWGYLSGNGLLTAVTLGRIAGRESATLAAQLTATGAN